MPVGNDGYRIPDLHEDGIKRKIEVLPGDEDEYSRTFVIHDEDHTLGNALKHIIVQSPDVQFAGYTVPHPMDRKIHIRIQTHKGKSSAIDILKESLQELKKQNENVLKMVQESVRVYQQENPASS